MIRIIFCAVAALVPTFPLVAQLTSQLSFSTYGIEEGLSQSTVLCSYQDIHGFTWFGTRDGLNKFDGYSFESFRHEPGNDSTLANNYILDLEGDNEGNLWIATMEGLSHYHFDRSFFKTYQLKQPGVDPSVWSLHLAEDGALWVGTKDGLFLFDKESGRFYKPNESPIFSAIGTKFVTAILEDRSGAFWVGTTDGLFHFDTKTNRVVTYHPDNAGAQRLSHPRVEDLVEADDGNIWAGTYGGGVNVIGPEGVIKVISAGSLLQNGFVRSLTFDNAGNLWIGTFEGLDIYNDSSRTVIHVKNDISRKQSLSHNSIRSLLRDSGGGIWVGTYFGGLNYYHPDNQRFRHYAQSAWGRQTISHDVVSDFSETPPGTLYIGTERGGLNVFDPVSGQFRAYTIHGRPDETVNTIKSLHVDQGGRLWLGTFKGGLVQFDVANETFHAYPDTEVSQYSVLKTAIVNDILEDQRGALWIATDKLGGIHRFDPSQKKFTPFALEDTLHGLLKDANVKSITQDRLGNLWLATHGKGLIHCNLAENTVWRYSLTRSEGAMAHEPRINAVFEDAGGRVWVATDGQGLFRLDRSKDDFVSYTTRHGLQNNAVLGVMEDKMGFLWITVIDGISRFDPSTETFFNFNYSNGLPLQELNEGASFCSADGSFYVGGNNGFISFSPASFIPRQQRPNIVFTSLRLFNRLVLPNDQTGILDRHITNTGSIALSYDQSNFTLSFAALGHTNPHLTRYRYRLDGLEADWNDGTDARTVTYSHLPEGTYSLMVQVADDDGQWRMPPKVLSVVIRPPFWRSWWAMLVYVAAIAGGALGIRHLAKRSAMMRHEIKIKELERDQMEKMHAYKLQSFTEISHEFRTPLTLIITPLEQVLEKDFADSWLNRQLRLMHFNARRLLLLINQVLEVNELESGRVVFEPVPLQLNPLMAAICENFQSVAQRHDISLSYAFEGEDVWLMADRDKIEKVVYNLISNAIKYNVAGGTVQVTLSVTKADAAGEFVADFSFRDTGRGIPHELHQKVFDRFYKKDTNMGSGIGLSLTRSLVEAMSGSITLSSAPGKGSVFRVSVPFQGAAWHANRDRAVGYQPQSLLEYEVAPVADDEDEPAQQRPGQPSVTILIAEDDPEIKAFLRENLLPEYEIIVAANGETGLEKARKANPDLILSDWMMPKLNGLDFCRAVKEDPLLCHIPFVLITAKGHISDKITSLESGADAFLAKPFSLKELKVTVRNLLRSREQLRVRFRQFPWAQQMPEQLQSYDEKLLQKVYQVVEKNLDNSGFNVDLLSSEVGISRVHLYRKLMALTGLSPSALIKDQRMQKAAALLQQQKINITEVAYQVGYLDLHYFSKAFKKKYGVSPSQFTRSSVAG